MSQSAKVQEPSMEEILASIRRIIADDDAVKTAKPPEPAATVPGRPAAPPRAPAPAATPALDRGLISTSTIAAVDSAFNTLAQTVIGQNARTLEDLVKEMLRPLLKSWLDDNLPGVVDRIVRAEIERVSRGRP